MKKGIVIILLVVIGLGFGVGARYWQEIKIRESVIVDNNVLPQEEETPSLVVEHLPNLATDKPPGADAGVVVLPAAASSFLERLFLQTQASNGELHHILAFLGKDPASGRNQIFSYDFDSGQISKLTDETETIQYDVSIIDAPVSAVLYSTPTSFKFLRLADGMVMTLSASITAGAHYYAVSPDYTRLAHFDENGSLIIRDLTKESLDVVASQPNFVGSSKGIADVSPIIYGPEGIYLYFYRPVTRQVGEAVVGANDIIKWNVDSGIAETVLSDGLMKRPPTIPSSDQNLYYVDYDIGDIAAQNSFVNKLNFTSGVKSSIRAVDFSAWHGLYLKDKVFIETSYTDGVINKQFFSMRLYDFAAGQSSPFFSTSIDIDPVKSGGGGLVGFGTRETEFVFMAQSKKEGSDYQRDFYLYDVASQQLRELFSTEVVITGERAG